MKTKTTLIFGMMIMLVVIPTLASATFCDNQPTAKLCDDAETGNTGDKGWTIWGTASYSTNQAYEDTYSLETLADENLISIDIKNGTNISFWFYRTLDTSSIMYFAGGLNSSEIRLGDYSACDANEVYLVFVDGENEISPTCSGEYLYVDGWYHFEIDLDYTAKTMSVKMDGTPLGTIPYDPTYTPTFSALAGTDGYMYIDNFLVYKYPTWDNGNGSLENPYQITNCAELQAIDKADPELTGIYSNFALINNINCSDTINWNNGSGFKAIGNGKRFEGHFEGNGYTISGIYSDMDNMTGSNGFAGLFANAGEDELGVIRNFTIDEYYFKGTTTGAVGGKQTANEHLTEYITIGNGVLIGTLNVGSIYGTFNTLNGIIRYVKSNATIYGNYSNALAGGIVGSHRGLIQQAKYSGTINADGAYRVGGIEGSYTGGTGYKTTTNSYVIGTINAYGNTYVGGITGVSTSTFSYDYTYFAGTINTNSTSYGALSGGGSIPASYAYNYFDNDTIGTTPINEDYTTAKTTIEMKQQATYTNWDFNNTWEMTENLTYPVLIWEGLTLPTPPCTPIYYCAQLGSCNITNKKPCLNVSDMNECGTPYNPSNYSDYEQNCTYTLPSQGYTPTYGTTDLIPATYDYIVGILVGLAGIALLLGLGVGLSIFAKSDTGKNIMKNLKR